MRLSDIRYPYVQRVLVPPDHDFLDGVSCGQVHGASARAPNCPDEPWPGLTQAGVAGPIAGMPDDRSVAPKGRSAAEARREREAEALRANLRRRKEQQRAREASVRAAPDGPATTDGGLNGGPLKPREPLGGDVSRGSAQRGDTASPSASPRSA